jgi:hypothetical protein
VVGGVLVEKGVGPVSVWTVPDETKVLALATELLGLITTSGVEAPEVSTLDAEILEGAKLADEAVEELDARVRLGRPALPIPILTVVVPLGPGLFIKPDLATSTESDIVVWEV